MYGKILIRTPSKDIPVLLITLPHGSALITDLRARDWQPYGNVGKTQNAYLKVSGGDLRLEVDGQDVLTGPNTFAPDGWWSATDRIGNKVLVLTVADGVLDIKTSEIEKDVYALVDSPFTACALVDLHVGLGR